MTEYNAKQLNKLRQNTDRLHKKVQQKQIQMEEQELASNDLK